MQVPTMSAVSGALPPSHVERQELQQALGKRGVLVGLKNLGATCYMNSLLQTLFMTPEFRDHVVAIPFDAPQRHSHNVAYQLQLLFARMISGRSAFLDPSALVASFGLGQDAHRQQHDVQELNRVLLEVLQQFITRRGAPEILREVFEGEFQDYKQCLICRTRTYALNAFQDLSVPIQGHGSLDECFAAYVAPNEIEGVRCDACAAHRTVHKGLAFHRLPRVLVLQLIRMDFNLTSMRREKIHHDVQLPLTFDATPYLADDAPSRSDADAEPEERHANQFRLHAVIAHRGSAYSGHYFCFVRVSMASDPPPQPEWHQQEVSQRHMSRDGVVPVSAEEVGGTWVKFDDDRVTYATSDEVEEYVDPARWKARATAVGDGDAERAGGDCVPEGFDGDAMSLFDNANGGDPAANSAAASRYVSGHSYYCVYRAASVPFHDLRGGVVGGAVSLNEGAVELPEYVRSAIAAEEEAHAQKQARLNALLPVLPVAVYVQRTSGPISAADCTLTGRPLVQQWIDCRAETTFSDVQERALELYARENGTRPDNACVRLRAFSATQSVLGESFSPTATLCEHNFTAESAVFPHVCLEVAPSAAVAAAWRPCLLWDQCFELLAFNRDLGSFAPTQLPVSVTSDATVAELISTVAEASGISPVEDALVSLKLDDEAVSVHCDPETGVLYDAAATTIATVSLARAAKVYVERRSIDAVVVLPPEVSIRAPWMRTSQAALLVEEGHLITVSYREATEDDDDKSRKAIGPARDDVPSLRIDGRRQMHELKAEVCRRLSSPGGAQFSPESCQMLVEGARREHHSPNATVRSASLHQRILEVTLAAGAPLAADEAYVAVFAATGDYAAPVAKLGQVLLKDAASTSDVLAEAFKLPLAASLLPTTDPSYIRLRLMPPHRSHTLGVPVFKPTLRDALVSGHHRDELKVVLEAIATPETLTKASLILHVHHWDALAASPASALGAETQVVTAKDAPASDVLALLAKATGVDAVSLDLAKARAYQLSSMTSVAKLGWGLIDASDAAALKKPVGGTPLKLEQDDVLVWRRKGDPWPEGVTPGTNGSPQSAVKGKKKGGDAGAKKQNKADRDEPAIRMQAVWEAPPEPAATSAADTAAKAGGADLDAATVAAIAAATAEGSGEEVPAEVQAQVAAAFGGGVSIDFLESQAYDPGVHGSLEEMCRICQCDFEEGDTMCILPCHHAFHRECLKGWIAHKPRCADCFGPLLPE